MTRKNNISALIKFAEADNIRAKSFIFHLREYIRDDLQGQLNQVHQDQLLNIIFDLSKKLDEVQEALENANIQVDRYGKSKGVRI